MVARVHERARARRRPRLATRRMVPVLLLHGSGPGTTAAAWNPLVEALGERFEVIAPDLPGFGARPGGTDRQWVGLLAPDEPCAIVGNSAGGALALKLAARGAGDARSSRSGRWATRCRCRPGWTRCGAPGRPRRRPENCWICCSTTHREMRPLQRGWRRCAPNRTTGSSSRHRVQRWVDALSLSEAELASITAPVLLIHGDRRPDRPARAQRHSRCCARCPTSAPTSSAAAATPHRSSTPPSSTVSS